jgi:hypothetical protein
MANDVKLGILNSEITLARTIVISLPTIVGKQMTSAVMSDGNLRYGMFAGQRHWQLSWVSLTAAQLADLVALRAMNKNLSYQNNYESTTKYTVVVTAFSYDVINPGITPTYYTATMMLEQAV